MTHFPFVLWDSKWIRDPGRRREDLKRDRSFFTWREEKNWEKTEGSKIITSRWAFTLVASLDPTLNFEFFVKRTIWIWKGSLHLKLPGKKLTWLATSVNVEFHAEKYVRSWFFVFFYYSCPFLAQLPWIKRFPTYLCTESFWERAANMAGYRPAQHNRVRIPLRKPTRTPNLKKEFWEAR